MQTQPQSIFFPQIRFVLLVLSSIRHSTYIGYIGNAVLLPSWRRTTGNWVTGHSFKSSRSCTLAKRKSFLDPCSVRDWGPWVLTRPWRKHGIFGALLLTRGPQRLSFARTLPLHPNNQKHRVQNKIGKQTQTKIKRDKDFDNIPADDCG